MAFNYFCNIRTRVYVYKDMISTAKSYFGNDSGNVVFPMGHKIGEFTYAAPNGYFIDIGEYVVTDDNILSVLNGYKDSNGNWVTLDATPITPNADELKINFNKSLNEGSRYFIEMTFTSDAVSVSVVAADEWDPKEDVNHDFE